MGAYTSIRGWIEVHDTWLTKIRDVLADHEARASEFGMGCESAELYNQGWIIPDEHINWTHYIFYGADIRTRCIDLIRSEMTAIAEMFMLDETLDGGRGIYPTGVIHVHEDGTFGYPDEVWEMNDGKMICRKVPAEHDDESDQAKLDSPP